VVPPCLQDKDGDTPLLWAVLSPLQGGDMDNAVAAVKALLAAGADPLASNLKVSRVCIGVRRAEMWDAISLLYNLSGAATWLKPQRGSGLQHRTAFSPHSSLGRPGTWHCMLHVHAGIACRIQISLGREKAVRQDNRHMQAALPCLRACLRAGAHAALAGG
jgi:hypothetical protein